jgi:type I restriction enzyme S subunit
MSTLLNQRAILGRDVYVVSHIGVSSPLGEIPGEWLYYWLKTIDFKDLTHATTLPSLQLPKVQVIDIPLPPLPEQQRIVAKIEELFTKLDAGVEALKKIKSQLRRYRQAVLKSAFEGKLTAEWRQAHQHELEPASVLLERIKLERKKTAKAKYKESPPLDTSGLPKLPEGWVWTSLTYCSREVYRYPTFYGMEHLDSGVPVIRGEHIKGDGAISHDWGNYWFVSPEVSSKFPRTVTEVGDIIMSVRGSVGKIGIVDELLKGAQVSPNCIRIALFKEQCLPLLVFHYLRSVSAQVLINTLINATTIQTIKAGLFTQIYVPLPPLPEQQRIVEEIERRFSVVDEIEKAVDQSLRQAERLRQSILKRAFQGKLVPQDPNDEPAEKLLERIKEEKSKSSGKKRQRSFSRARRG